MISSWWERARRPLLWVLAVLIFLGALVAAIWGLPSVLTRHPSAGLTAAARLGAENAARAALVAALAVVGAAALTARYTWRAARLTEEGQITDRYTKALDQLGGTSLDVRIGGIYALERIARDSARDHPVVMEVLTAFVREHSQEQWLSPANDGNGMLLRTIRPEVQAAATVIGRRSSRNDRGRIDLTKSDLINADLIDADLTDADLTDASLTSADLRGADLRGAYLRGAYLTGASLTGADLRGADLTGADLNDVYLRGADLRGADLTDADLTDADLTEADLTEADLTRADFTGAKAPSAMLDNTHLSDAASPKAVNLPAGWVRDLSSGRLKRAGN